MIRRDCFSRGWLQKKREQFGKVDPGILEKCIHALALLGHLGDSGLEFIFKGGTSLLLHVSSIKRLSIDIDIVCNEKGEKLDKILAEIARMSPFTDFTEDDRGARGLPHRRHFRFYYNQVPGGHPAPFILLDVVEDECTLPLVKKTICSDFIEVERDVAVTIPTIEGLLGDKLSAFAPNTIGVPYTTSRGVNQAMQVAKQMFDIGELFNIAEDVSQIIEAYNCSFHKENSYRDSGFTIDQVLEDTISTGSKLCHWGLKGYKEDTGISLLVEGAKNLSSHLVQSSFRPNIEAKIAASKAALVAHLVQNEMPDIALPALRFQGDIQKIKEISLQHKYNHLQKLKTICIEAFYYWHKIEILAKYKENVKALSNE
jgi:hypothetical protein